MCNNGYVVVLLLGNVMETRTVRTGQRCEKFALDKLQLGRNDLRTEEQRNNNKDEDTLKLARTQNSRKLNDVVQLR